MDAAKKSDVAIFVVGENEAPIAKHGRRCIAVIAIRLTCWVHRMI